MATQNVQPKDAVISQTDSHPTKTTAENISHLLSRPRAKLLYEEGLRCGVDVLKKALANDLCGEKLSRNAPPLACKNRFTPCCARRTERAWLKKRRRLIAYFKEIEFHSAFFFSFETPAERTADSIRAFSKKIRAALDEMLQGRTSAAGKGSGNVYHWDLMLNGWRRDWICGTAIIISVEHRIKTTDVRQVMREMLGQDSQISVYQITDHSQLRKSFVQLFKLIVPEGYHEQVSLEIAFHKLPMTYRKSRDLGELSPPA